MLSASYHEPFRVVCFTDEPEGIKHEIECLPNPVDFSHIKAPQGQAYPSCYRRLWLFSEDAAELFDGPIVNLDVDLVVAGDVTGLFDRDGDFVGWRDPDMPGLVYSGGMWMLKPGARSEVWDSFDPERSPEITRSAGLIGSDQAWLSHTLAHDEPAWTREDGVWRTRCMRPGQNDALIVQTPSLAKPWTSRFQRRWPHYAQIWNQAK